MAEHIDAERWLQRGEWVGVESSNVKQIRYDMRRKILSVQFWKKLRDGTKVPGKVYLYIGPSPEVARGMFNASSHGKYVHSHLKGRYPYV